MKTLAILSVFFAVSSSHAADISYQASDYYASTAKEKFLSSTDRLKQIEYARAKYLCGSSEVESYAVFEGGNSLLYTLVLSNDLAVTGIRTGVEEIYLKGDKLVQGSVFERLICKD